MDWLCTVEFIAGDNGEARLFATEIIGHPLATLRRQTRAHSRSSAMLMPIPTTASKRCRIGNFVSQTSTHQLRYHWSERGTGLTQTGVSGSWLY
jgi:hypothetical protein